jgi:hypothetical protein
VLRVAERPGAEGPLLHRCCLSSKRVDGAVLSKLRPSNAAVEKIEGVFRLSAQDDNDKNYFFLAGVVAGVTNVLRIGTIAPFAGSAAALARNNTSS